MRTTGPGFRALAVLIFSFPLVLTTPAAAFGTPQPRAPVVKTLGWGFKGLQFLATAGTNLWSVGNASGGQNTPYLVEQSASNGALERVVAGPSYGFDDVTAFAAIGTNLWVASWGSAGEQGQSLDELNASTGALETRFGLPGGLPEPLSLATDGNDVWIELGNPYYPTGGTLLEYDASSGTQLDEITSAPFANGYPNLAVAAGHLFVGGSQAVDEYDASTGDFIQQIDLTNDVAGGLLVVDMVSVGSDVWVADGACGSPSCGAVVELDGSSGSALDEVTTTSNSPAGIVVDGAQLWVEEDAGHDLYLASLANPLNVVKVANPLWQPVAPDLGEPFPLMAAAGHDVWSSGTNQIALFEFSDVTGKVLRVTFGSQYRLDAPRAIVHVGDDLWILNAGGWITVMNWSTEKRVTWLEPPPSKRWGTPEFEAAVGPDVWVSCNNHKIAVFNGSTAKLLRVINAQGDGLAPDGPLLALRTDVWYAPEGLAEYSSGGLLLRRVRAHGYRIDGASGITPFGNELWIADQADNALTEVSSSTGTLVRVVDSSADGLSSPSALAISGSDLWVTDEGDSSLTELNAATGARIAETGSEGALSSPDAIASVSGDLWIANLTGDELTEIDPTNGDVVDQLVGTNGALIGPDGIDVDGSAMFIPNATQSVTEVSP